MATDRLTHWIFPNHSIRINHLSSQRLIFNSSKEMVMFFSWLQNEYVSNPDGAAPRGEKQLTPQV
jgi:hypothetical protein